MLSGQPVPDLHAGATSLTGLLRSGLGRLRRQAAPKPSDCAIVILFVVGGLSLAELQEIQQAVDDRAAAVAAAAAEGGGGAGAAAPPRILVGGTALLRQRDLASHLFAGLQAE